MERSSLLLHADLRVEYSSGSAQGSGALSDLSEQGAVVSTSGVCPPSGASVWLVVRVGNRGTLELFGDVVGPTSDGFAVAFASASPEVLALLDCLERPAAVDRRSARLEAGFSVLLSMGREEGSGTIVEISRAGARLELNQGRSPPIGSRVRLLVSGFGERSVELQVGVVRHTEGGFAVRFELVTVELLSLLESLGPS